MSVCVIYGPVASGKLTTARAFAELTNYKVFHNHLIQDITVDLFPYDREDLRKTRANLNMRIRKEVLSAALGVGLDIVITMNYGGTGGPELLRHIVSEGKKYKQNVYIVRLMPSREELDRRVVGDSRKKYKKVNDPKVLAQLLGREGFGYDKFPDFEHLEIDNTYVLPDQTVKIITEHYRIIIDKNSGGTRETTN